MKFDENGQLIRVVKKSIKSLFMEKVMADVEVISKHFGIDQPTRIKLKNGYGGSYRVILKQLEIGFGNGDYTKATREVVMHEMVHHMGYDHGNKVMGHKFRSHHNKDFLSPILVKKIFGDRKVE